MPLLLKLTTREELEDLKKEYIFRGTIPPFERIVRVLERIEFAISCYFSAPNKPFEYEDYTGLYGTAKENDLGDNDLDKLEAYFPSVSIRNENGELIETKENV